MAEGSKLDLENPRVLLGVRCRAKLFPTLVIVVVYFLEGTGERINACNVADIRFPADHRRA